MITENLSTLKIHRLTQEQYDRELENGNLDENALYLTPNKEIDLSLYATTEQLNGAMDEINKTIEEVEASVAEKANETHLHEISDVTNLQSTLDILNDYILNIDYTELEFDTSLIVSDEDSFYPYIAEIDTLIGEGV